MPQNILQKNKRQQRGFSLIEVIIAVALIAFVYAVAIPQLSLQTGAEAVNKVNQIASDIRNAYDLSVLSGKTYRLVFNFASGDYRLEEASRSNVFLGDAKLDHDPTEQEEKDAQEAFDEEFKKYVELAGDIVKDADSGEEIPPSSPVVEAKSKLEKPRWTPVNSAEWGKKSIGPHMLIKDMQAEHHAQKQELAMLGPEARGFIYFFPNGYVQRAVVHVAYNKGDGTADEKIEPYTIITNPWEGTADVVSGYQEVDVHEDKEE